MTCDDLRRRAAVVREVPLETVLLLRGAVRDRHDQVANGTPNRARCRSRVPKFMNWHSHQGGGGAIDLVMHLAKVDYRTAVAWLEQHFGVGHVAVGVATQRTAHQERRAGGRPASLQLPLRDDRLLHRVTQYLTRRRRLRLNAARSAAAIRQVVRGPPRQCRLSCWWREKRSDRSAPSCVAPGRASGVGWRQAPGRTWATSGSAPRVRRQIVLCESAIDAISCFQMHPERICISTSGVRANPLWLRGLIAHGYEIHCGFDADDPGDAAADRMITLLSHGPTSATTRPRLERRARLSTSSSQLVPPPLTSLSPSLRTAPKTESYLEQ